MIFIGILGSIFFGNLQGLNDVILNESSRAIEFCISLAAIMAFWMGIMNIAKDSGLIDKLGEKMSWIFKKLFPNLPKNNEAMSYIMMNIILNMLGAGNGATSFGIKAMDKLQSLNPKKDRATNEMIMFLVINISSIQLIPFTMLKIRSDLGSKSPNDIIVSTLIATSVSTLVAIVSCKLFERGRR